MEVRLDAGRGPLSEAAVAGRDVRFHPDDRLELGLLRLFLELPGRVHVTVICDRERGLLELQSPLDQVIDPVGAVEEGILRMTVEMDESHGACKLAAATGSGEGERCAVGARCGSRDRCWRWSPDHWSAPRCAIWYARRGPKRASLPGADRSMP